jgi:nitroreductase
VSATITVAEAIECRRSIRHYEARPVPAELVEKLAAAALRAPTSRNLQSWHFAFTDDSEALTALSKAKASWAEPIGRAPLAVAVCGNEYVSDCWIEDASIAAAFMQLAATELGLGTCWIQMRERHDDQGRAAEDNVRQILDLPDNLRVLCVLSIGYPAEDKPGHAADKLAWDKVSRPTA